MVAVALLVSISNTLIERKGVIGSILKLVTGLVLAIVIVSPWIDFRFSDLEQMYYNVNSDASSLVEQGILAAHAESSAYIKEQTQAYILDKASTLSLDISADVMLTEESPPSIETIVITGIASPYAKKRLMQIICEEFGVTEECLTWTQRNG